jgi:uncharacterized protein involved in outer membrane biogenesis
MRLPAVFCCPRGRRIVLGALLAPPLLWAALLAVIPTDCARQKIADRLSRASGRKVALGCIRVGLMGDVHLADLRIGAPDSSHDAWLKLDEASIDVSLVQLLLGHVDPTHIEVRGLHLRVLRRKNGSLELSDFLQSSTDPQPSQAGGADCPGPTDLTWLVHDSKVTVIDEPTGTHLEFTGVEGRVVCRGRIANVPELRGTVNGGRFQLAAQLDRSGAVPTFEGQFKANGVSLSEGMNALAYLVPVFDGSSASLEGRLALNLYAKGEGGTRDAICRSLVGHGNVVLDPIRFDGSRLLDELSNLVELPPQGRVGSVRSDLTIKNGRLATDAMTFDVARVPVILSGWTDFEGRVNYRVKVDGLTDRLPSKAKEVLSELAIDVNEVADVRVRGTTQALEVTVDNVALGPASAPGGTDATPSDREKLREIGRRIRDRIRR